jgi:hypothetical protein
MRAPKTTQLPRVSEAAALGDRLNRERAILQQRPSLFES